MAYDNVAYLKTHSRLGGFSFTRLTWRAELATNIKPGGATRDRGGLKFFVASVTIAATVEPCGIAMESQSLPHPFNEPRQASFQPCPTEP
jgi:hypothetical protein